MPGPRPRPRSRTRACPARTRTASNELGCHPTDPVTRGVSPAPRVRTRREGRDRAVPQRASQELVPAKAMLLAGGMLLTVDLGTSATKAVLWDHDGPVAMGRAELPTFHPEPGLAEQDAEDWWSSMLDACAQVRAQAEKHFLELTAIGFSTARETFVPVRADGHALGPALLWSDRRAGPEAAQLSAAAGGVDALRERTGIMVDAGSAVAKVAWLRAHQPERLRRARWLLGPRDFVFRRLTGEVATDPTFAGRSGFYDQHGALAPETTAGVEALLPPVLPSTTSMPLADTEAGVPAGTTVVLGGGDRQCEVLGTGASADMPMVSWGTTANVSLPTTTVPSPLPVGLVASRGAIGGHLLEAGL